MIWSERTWKQTAVTAAVLGMAMIAAGIVGYGLGWNDIGGTRHGSNIVPFMLFGGVAALVVAGGVLLARAPSSLPVTPTRLAILALAGICGLFVVLYARHISPVIFLRADIVMGSESQFVDQIIRYRAGQPQYTPPEDANSTAYAPGAPMLTYAIASVLGHPTSVPAYRLVQQLYLLTAVLFCTLAIGTLLNHLRPADDNLRWWPLFWAPLLYLVATNPATNLYTYTLYSDGLGLAVGAIATWVLMKHLVSGNDRWLILMALIPAIGFMAKQKEAVWLALYATYLLLAGRTAFSRIIAMVAGGSLLLLSGVLLSYAAWGPSFWFWNFDVLSRLHVSLKEILNQLQDGSHYLIPGLIGGLILLRGDWAPRLFSAWLCWLVQMVVGIYTSGIAFRPAHFGPATMFGMVWMLAGLAVLWPPTAAGQSVTERQRGWVLTAGLPLVLLFCLVSGGLLRNGRAIPPGMETYLRAIEEEFRDLDASEVLLDSGSWLYLERGVVMRDRESPLGTLWGTGASDYQATVDRFRQGHYKKILARKDAFFYRDPRLRNALLEGYRETRTIPGTGLPEAGWLYPFLLSDIAVLEPQAR